MPEEQSRRVGHFIYLKPDKLEAYKECHTKVWPDVLAQIKDSNIEDYSIFFTPAPRPMLFASFKYVGTDWDIDMKRMRENPKVQEWWALTDSMQESPVEGSQGSTDKNGWWGEMEEVFRLEEQI